MGFSIILTSLGFHEEQLDSFGILKVKWLGMNLICIQTKQELT